MVRQNNERVREQKVAEQKEEAEENVWFEKIFREKIRFFARCERKNFIRILQNIFFQNVFEFETNLIF